MKKATTNLEDDHIHILRLTEVIEHITNDNDPDVNTLQSIVDIIRNFADGIHHAKEENIFFPFLSKRGFSNKSGPVAVMLNEHVAGRDYVKTMQENIMLFKDGDKGALGKIYGSMKGYAALLQSHISKENNILFRMADGLLSAEDHENIILEFSKTESSMTPSSEYIKMIDNLATLYHVNC